MKDWLNEHKFYLIAAVLLVFGCFYYFYLYDNEELPLNSSISQVDNKQQSAAKDAEKKELPEKIMVDVKGQIKLPGVYLSNSGERVIDVINRAGGLTDKADQSKVNFAEHVHDEMLIYIPAIGEEGVPAPGTSGGAAMTTSGGAGQTQGKININKANDTELQTLPGIGPAKAAAIVEYRNSNGPFKAVEDIKNISGIGDKTFEKLKDSIAVH
ncbi:helix-hairpin-helix domain-containing protein [Neobacillus sp. NPDC058068]|uniref:helix-hairpin-helix domain-containing protein n=1 Tax=Neobacillus sp. NPDC058068 TaxID=3346325 RepID=UPI0036D8069D